MFSGMGAEQNPTIAITEKMFAAGMDQWFKNRDFENDWEVVARIYTAMRLAEHQDSGFELGVVLGQNCAQGERKVPA